jgi:thiamine-phosphate pyrophosphorylase
MSKPFDLNLYMVTDAPERCRYGLLETVRRAVAGGVSIVQYRRDLEDHAAVLAEVLPLRDFLRGAGVPLIINNDVALAVEIGADGIHIGQSDMPVAEARKLIGPNMILGFSVSNQAEMDAVPVELVDYVGCGPVYPTATKLDAAADIGLQSWAAVAASCPLPVVAIGGIDAERARAIRATGVAAGVAVVSAICAAADPKQAARELM